LIDAIVLCGSIDDVVMRVGEHHAAGADHVCIQVLTADSELPMRHWRDLAAAFSL
jgi:2-methylisocitrate lyase-like PEP mutase family enzyme